MGGQQKGGGRVSHYIRLDNILSPLSEYILIYTNYSAIPELEEISVGTQNCQVQQIGLGSVLQDIQIVVGLVLQDI